MVENLTGSVAFVQTVEASSFVGASQRLGLSPSAVGKSVARLEQHLGVRLLQRSTRRVSLTGDGERFYERCRHILDALGEAGSMMLQANAAPHGRLRVSLPTIGYRFLLPILPEFAERYPEVDLELDFNDRIVDVIEGGFDAAIRSGDLPDSQLMAKRLGPFRFVLCASPAYLQQRGVPLTPADLAKHTCLRFRFPTSGKLQHWAFRGLPEDAAAGLRGLSVGAVISRGAGGRIALSCRQRSLQPDFQFMSTRFNAAFTALLAAALFGATTPLAKALLGSLSPFLLAGLFYLGSGTGLAAVILMRRLQSRARGQQAGHDRFPLREVPWLAGAIAAGGVAGPALLMLGLQTTPAATGSLLLNLEGVFTALIAWVVFRENVDVQVFLGMVAIVAGGVVLSWQPGAIGLPPGTLLLAAACACWAIDNNLTRKVSANDAMFIACVKGLVAGSVNVALALTLGAAWPKAATVALAMLTGFAGYGVSLVLFVVALRNLGTARTGAYFSVAPLFGVTLSWVLWPEMPPLMFWAAAALMTLGVWLHIRERHEHPHTHDALDHTHRHRHDAHHQHEHDFAWDGKEPHTHPHRHAPITHAHAHFPDIHHRHTH